MTTHFRSRKRRSSRKRPSLLATDDRDDVEEADRFERVKPDGLPVGMGTSDEVGLLVESGSACHPSASHPGKAIYTPPLMDLPHLVVRPKNVWERSGVGCQSPDDETDIVRRARIGVSNCGNGYRIAVGALPCEKNETLHWRLLKDLREGRKRKGFFVLGIFDLCNFLSFLHP